MTVAKQTRKCPFCKETILEGATRCKHCHAELSKPKPSRFKHLDTFRTGFLSGILFTLVLFVLIYFQFWGE